MAIKSYKDEVWKIHPKHPNYKFSNYGRCIGIKSKVLRKTRINRKGYECIDLFENGKTHKYNVHRIIAELFVHNPDPNLYTQVNHIDEIKYNNVANNLEWVTPKQNANYGNRNKNVSESLKKYYFKLNNCTINFNINK